MKSIFFFHIQWILIALIGTIIFVHHLYPEVTSKTHQFLVNERIIETTQLYVFPAWKEQEQQLHDNHFQNVIIPYNLTITLSIFYTIVILIIMALRYKKIFSYVINSIINSKHNLNAGYFLIISFAIILILYGLWFVLFDQEFVFHGYGRFKLRPSISGVIIGGWFVFAEVVCAFLVFIFFIPCLIHIKIKKLK